MNKTGAIKIFFHISSGAVFSEKPQRHYYPHQWIVFDSKAEFNCFNVVRKVVSRYPNLSIKVHDKITLLPGCDRAIPLVNKIDFSIISQDEGKTLLLIEYKGGWIHKEMAAETLLYYQLNLVSRLDIPYLLATEYGNLLSPISPYKSMETSMRFLDKRIQQTIEERMDDKCS